VPAAGRADAHLIREVYNDPYLPNTIVGYNIIADETGRWAIATSDEEFFWFGAEPAIVDRLFDLAGGEKILECYFAIRLWFYQCLVPVGLITEVYEATDWEVPFRLDPSVKALSPEGSERACLENDKAMLRKFDLPLWYARE
tara:strand:+ start:2436 stop:2861 length:426 start_codon:yes stop_codon:yes gene_type:complete